MKTKLTNPNPSRNGFAISITSKVLSTESIALIYKYVYQFGFWPRLVFSIPSLNGIGNK
jgi:hypothetical protein